VWLQRGTIVARLGKVDRRLTAIHEFVVSIRWRIESSGASLLAGD
jgi:hypothetical protein